MLKLSKYQTIDPLILQTLNLNQRRMSHILSILHGTPNQIPQKSSLKHSILKKSNQKEFNFQPTKPIKNQFLYQNKIPLPKINNRQRDDLSLIQEKTYKNKLRGRNYSTVQYSRVQQTKEEKEELRGNVDRIKNHRKYNMLTQNQEEEQNKFSQLLNKKSNYRQRQSQPKSSRVSLLLQQQKDQSPFRKIPSLRPKKSSPSLVSSKSRLISDYLSKVSLKGHKSLHTINPKDLYRYEIEEIMKQTTTVEKIEDSERRMKRVKRRHQHLKRFDRQYYSKLNRLDLENCQYKDK